MATDHSSIGFGFHARWLLATIVGYGFGSLAGFVLGHFFLGNVAIGVREHLLTGTIHKVLDRFCTANPNVYVKVETADHYQLRDKLLEFPYLV